MVGSSALTYLFLVNESVACQPKYCCHIPLLMSQQTIWLSINLLFRSLTVKRLFRHLHWLSQLSDGSIYKAVLHRPGLSRLIAMQQHCCAFLHDSWVAKFDFPSPNLFFEHDLFMLFSSPIDFYYKDVRYFEPYITRVWIILQILSLSRGFKE